MAVRLREKGLMGEPRRNSPRQNNNAEARHAGPEPGRPRFLERDGLFDVGGARSSNAAHRNRQRSDLARESVQRPTR